METNVIEQLIGKTFKKIEQRDDEVIFHHEDEKQSIRFYHQQDCCEGVWIEDIIGDLSDLEGVPILKAEERISYDYEEAGYGDNTSLDISTTWTFYHFATVKGYVDVRWIGTSNGYYSEYVSIESL